MFKKLRNWVHKFGNVGTVQNPKETFHRFEKCKYLLSGRFHRCVNSVQTINAERSMLFLMPVSMLLYRGPLTPAPVTPPFTRRCGSCGVNEVKTPQHAESRLQPTRKSADIIVTAKLGI